MNQNRRTFIKVTSLASATLVPVVGTLAQVLGKKEGELSTLLGGSLDKDFEFHVIDNNLLNLHFYFINVKKSGSSLVPASTDTNLKSFFIVRLPQMHISEKGFWYKNWNDSKERLPDATLSGYSYLAFQLWPDKPSTDKKSKIPHPNKRLKFTLENLLNWNDENNFELITLVEWFDLKKHDSFAFADFKKCGEFNSQKVWHLSNEETSVEEASKPYYIKESSEPTNSFNYKKYKSLVRHFLDQNLKPVPTVNNFIPITLLEFPQGVVLVPIARDSSGALVKSDNKPSKQFWLNKFVNQEKSAFGYRKYEIWNNTLFYKTKIDDKQSGEPTFKIETPSFRIAGLITKADVECPASTDKSCEEASIEGQKHNIFPSLLDKAELTFLTQFAKGENEYSNIDFRNEKFDIRESNGLFFTGLGIITHLKYYNEDAPKGVDLIEYEHIITQGRDIFIKVARIGIHNKNGKRYKHVIEGKRKIETEIKDPATGQVTYTFPDGATSFIELKQYCECIEKKKIYEFSDGDIASWKDSDFDIPNFDNQTKEIFNPAVANKAHFRRFTWKELRTIEKKRIPIETYQDKSDGTIKPISNPECALWFWPVLEGTLSNPKYLHSVFDADDWDKGTLNLATPFIFIRKSVFEEDKIYGETTDDIKKQIADSYFLHLTDEPTHPANLRRKVIVNNQKIAFTKPLPVNDITALQGEELNNALNESKNKTHILETDFIEPYFNLVKKSVAQAQPFKDIRFPLLPQVLRAKVFVDHIRDLTQQKIPSVVEYHENYIKHEFIESVVDPIDATKKQYANAAKQILANTDAFINGKEEVGNNKYGDIKNALQEAKDKLGNLAVPDIIPDTISLEKFGVTLPKGINDSIATGRTVLSDATAGLQKIASFNPRELLRGKLSDVCGLDLTAILDELIPAGSDNNQTPLFEINKLANKITSEVEGSEVFQDIQKDIEAVRNKIKDLEDGLKEGQEGYKTLASQINAKEQELINNLKQLSNYIPNAEELNNLIKSQFEQLRIKAFKAFSELQPFSDIQQLINSGTDIYKEAVKFIDDERILLKHEILDKENDLKNIVKEINNIYQEEINSVLNLSVYSDLKMTLEEIFKDETNNCIKEIIKIYENYIKGLNGNNNDVYKQFNKVKFEGLFSTSKEDKDYLLNGKKIYINPSTYEFEEETNKSSKSIQFKILANSIDSGVIQLQNKLNDFNCLIAKNINGNSFQQLVVAELQKPENQADPNSPNIIKKYTSRLNDLRKKLDAFSYPFNSPRVNEFEEINLGQYSERIDKWLPKFEEIFQDAIKKELPAKTQDSILKIKNLITRFYPYVDILRRIDPYFYYSEHQRLTKEIDDIKRRFLKEIYNTLSEIETAIQKKFDDIANPYNVRTYVKFRDSYLAAIKAFDIATSPIPEAITKEYNDCKGKFGDLKSEIITDLKEEAKKKIQDFVKNNSELKSIYDKIYGDIAQNKKGLIQEVKEKQKQYEDTLLNYKNYVDAKIKLLGDNMVDQIATYIANHPDEVEKVQEAQNIYRLLTSIKQQDLTYNWSTDKFRDINFGIVSFKKFSNPNTTLRVDVKATTYFTSGKFPPAIERVVTYSENRFTNFGISFFNSLTVNFNEISFIAGSDHSTHFDVKIKDVKFDGALSFVQAFESWLQTMGKGLILQLHGDHVALGYSLAIPAIKTPGFNIFNLSLNFDLRVYFDKRPLRFGFSLARPDSKFGVAVGIYAGFGFFGIVADPKKGIVEIDCALEAGAWAGISIGPISGEVKLAFGFRYTKNEFGVRIEGYIVAEGRLTVWILEVSARIYLGVVSQNSYVEGVCTVTYSVKLGFISKSFSGSFHKKIAGANSNNHGENSKTLKEFGYDMNLIQVSDSIYSTEALLATLARKAADEDEIHETNPVSSDNWAKFINVF